MSSIAPELLQAYRETGYEVFADPPFTLRIGVASEALRTLHQRHAVHCSAFVSACNPFSRPLEARANAARHRELLRELGAAGLTCIAGQGRHPDNGWPSEASVLVLGVTLEASRSLGQRLAQNALVWCDSQAVAELILLR